MSNLKDSQNSIDEQKVIDGLMARHQERTDPMETILSGTEGQLKLQIKRFWITDLGVRVVISLMINWEFDENEEDYFVGEWLEYARDTVDLWSAEDRERFIQYCRRRLQQISYVTENWSPQTNPEEFDRVLFGIEDQIQMNIS